MRRLVIALPATFSFAAIVMATWFVGLRHNQDAACDGVCVDMFPMIGALALAFGVLGALVSGFAASAVIERRSAGPS